MTTDGKVEGVEKGKALFHDRRMEDRGEEIKKNEKRQEAREHEKIKSSCH